MKVVCLWGVYFLKNFGCKCKGSKAYAYFLASNKKPGFCGLFSGWLTTRGGDDPES